MIAQKNGSFVELQFSDGKNTLLNDRKIQDILEFRTLEHDNRIIINFGGTDTVILKKDRSHEWFDLKYRYVVTDFFIENNKLIFGSVLGSYFHFVIYDIEKRKRLFQTQSIQSRTLSYKITSENLYVIMGNSQIICYDHQGKEQWKKFEKQHLVPGLAFYKNKLVYSSNNQIKITDGKNTETIRVPTIRLDKIEAIIGNKIYCVCGDKSSICCFDLERQQLLYEIKGQEKTFIRKLLITQGQQEEYKPFDLLLFSNDTHLGIVDLKRGMMKFYLPLPRIKRIMKNSDVIILTHKGESHIVRDNKEKKDEDTIITL